MTELFFFDHDDPESKKDNLEKFIFPDIFDQSGGFFSKSDIRGSVLDLGCGKGSSGAALKEINPLTRLTGVDLFRYKEKQFESVYDQIVRSDVLKFVQGAVQGGLSYDLIIGISLPPQLVADLLDNPALVSLVKKGGKILFVYDFEMNGLEEGQEEKGFKFFSGRYNLDRRFAIFKKI